MIHNQCLMHVIISDPVLLSSDRELLLLLLNHQFVSLPRIHSGLRANFSLPLHPL